MKTPELVLRCDRHPTYDGTGTCPRCVKCRRVRYIAKLEREAEKYEIGTLGRTCAEAAVTVAKWSPAMQRSMRIEGSG